MAWASRTTIRRWLRGPRCSQPGCAAERSSNSDWNDSRSPETGDHARNQPYLITSSTLCNPTESTLSDPILRTLLDGLEAAAFASDVEAIRHQAGGGVHAAARPANHKPIHLRRVP